MADSKLIDELRALRRARPFRPFVFSTQTWGELAVWDAKRFGSSGDRICVFPPGGPMRLLRSHEVISVRHFSDEEVKEHRRPLHLRDKKPDASGSD